MASDPPILVAEGLRIETTDGIEIVADVSLSVKPGETLALVGESGCGKTSVALALLGHARPGTRIAAGSITLHGRDIVGLPPSSLEKTRGRVISYIPQSPASALNPRHRVGRQIAEVLVVHGNAKTAANAIVRDLMRRVHLPDTEEFLRRYPFELSGGQQQRVTIAMALACKPPVVVLDEPTTGLDVTTQAKVLALLRELGRETGTAFVYVTHDLAVVDTLADRVAVIYAGRIVESGPREEVFRNPAHPYTTLLLASVPRLSIRRELVGIAGAAPSPGDRPAGCFFEPRCPLAVSHCRVEFPPPSFPAPDHSVRCWRAAEFAAPSSQPGPRAAVEARRDGALLEVAGLVASFGNGKRRNEVLHDVSLELLPGECLALVGESGSGKTTLGRCIAGLHRPDGGLITLTGSPLAASAGERARAERQAVQIIFQNPERSLNPSETAGVAVARPLQLFNQMTRAAERRAVVDYFERVRLPARFIDRYPRELSGGEKQRVAIARALVAEPSLIVCDEITSALDVSTQAAIVSLLAELRLSGLALLFITHNLALVNSIADRILVIEDGTIREQGLTRDVIDRPSHTYTRELLAASPEIKEAAG